VQVRAEGTGGVSMAGVQLLAQTARVSGLDAAMSVALAPWRKPRAVHDPGKTIVVDVAMALAAGGDCPADVAVVRAGSALLGPVASDPTISRLVDLLAADSDAALAAIRGAHAQARARVRQLAPLPADDAGDAEVVVDIDATLLTAHSEKEGATPTYKRGFGHHPLMAYLDHGSGGTGEALAGLLRPGNAGAGTAVDHLKMLGLIVEQLTDAELARLVIRTDTAACTHAFLAALTARNFNYSVGFYARTDVAEAVAALPAAAWIPAIDAAEVARDGAWVAEITSLLNLSNWPTGLRVIVRKERPHPGAPLRLTDVDGHRITCFATNHTSTDLPALELRHRRRARCEDRIRNAKDTGLHNLPYRDLASNQIWIELVLPAQDLLAWMQLLALDGEHAVAEPKRLRLHLFTICGRLIRTARRRILNLDANWPWANDVLHALQRLHDYAPG
jgi:hypothetical protein